MAEYNLVMPKMGESVIEATVLSWRKRAGESVQENEVLLEVATDKVDSEVPCPVSGVITRILHEEGAVVPVGDVLAIIETSADVPAAASRPAPAPKPEPAPEPAPAAPEPQVVAPAPKPEAAPVAPAPEPAPAPVPAPVQPEPVSSRPEAPAPRPAAPAPATNGRYYSPLVLNIAWAENISMTELEQIPGTGLEGRVTKEDILAYLETRKTVAPVAAVPAAAPPAEVKAATAPEIRSESKPAAPTAPPKPATPVSSGNTEIIEMDRMRKLIAQHMVNSKNVSAHVSSFVECDVTPIVRWRNQNKDSFKKRYGFNLTFMPVFVEAIAKAIRDLPMINVSVDGDKIIKKLDINIGIATALPSGNLIVPVVRQADRLNLFGLANAINTLVNKARTNSLSPDDIQDGTYTISNIGTFGNIIGTPIINQPQVAIMAVGSITKKLVVVEENGEDAIAIRHMMYLSHTYDHRVVDGMLGGMFVRKVADYLEQFDQNTAI